MAPTPGRRRLLIRPASSSHTARPKPAPARLEIATAAGVFDAVAAGPPEADLVLLLHGFPQSSYEWRHQLPALAAAGYRVVAPDQRGYSHRARPNEVAAYHVDRLVEDVLDLADELGAGRLHLAGHDWGGVVAWAVAGRHPDRLRSLISVSTPHPLALARALASPSGDQVARSGYIRLFRQTGLAERLLLEDEGSGLRALFANTAYTDRAAIEEYLSVVGDPAALTAVLNWYRALDPASLAGIGTISTPTLFVWGSDDPALGREAAEGTAEWVSGPYRFVELPRVSHWVPEHAPDELNRLLLEHLEAVRNAG